MKIGIITFQRSYNNGAVLQAYALQRTLCKFGADADILDYRNKEIEKPAAIIQKSDGLGVKALIKILFRLRRHHKINKFMRTRMRFTNSIDSFHELEQIRDIYDAFITGSDQVWNNTHIKGDKSYFLDFVRMKSKKYSYAASINGGEAKAEETIGLYDDMIKSFAGISLREENIANVFRRHYGSRVRCDLDPVLLLNKKEWEECVAPRLHKKKYIFMYLVPKSKNIRKYAERLAKINGYDLIDNKTSKEFFLHCGIEEFLSWIYYAEYVVTNSFHGTAFSVIFNRFFSVELDTDIGYNNRSSNLLEKLDINGVEITSADVTWNSGIDYKIINGKMQEMRAQSLKYLEEISSMKEVKK